jgi:hypothetical protein
MLYCCHAGRLTTVHVPGVENVMSDIASCPSKAQTLFCPLSLLSNTNFLSLFDTAFPLPNTQAWTLAMVPQWLKSNVFEMLRGKQLELRQWTGPSANPTGQCGRRTAISFPKPATSWQVLAWTNSSRLLLPCGKDSTVLELRSRFIQLKGLSGTLPKGLFWTDIPTLAVPSRPSNHLTSPLPV